MWHCIVHGKNIVGHTNYYSQLYELNFYKYTNTKICFVENRKFMKNDIWLPIIS